MLMVLWGTYNPFFGLFLGFFCTYKGVSIMFFTVFCHAICHAICHFCTFLHKKSPSWGQVNGWVILAGIRATVGHKKRASNAPKRPILQEVYKSACNRLQIAQKG